MNIHDMHEAIPHDSLEELTGIKQSFNASVVENDTVCLNNHDLRETMLIDAMRDYDIEGTLFHVEQAGDTWATDSTGKVRVTGNAYTKRIKAIHDRESERAGIAGTDAYNRVIGDSNLSPEILAILSNDPDAVPDEIKKGTVCDKYAANLDKAISLPEAGEIASYNVMREACWTSNQAFENEGTTGKYRIATGSGFDPKKYVFTQASKYKKRSYHDIPEMLNKANKPRTKFWHKQISMAIDTYVPTLRVGFETEADVTDILDGLKF